MQSYRRHYPPLSSFHHLKLYPPAKTDPKWAHFLLSACRKQQWGLRLSENQVHKRLKPLHAFAVINHGDIEGVELRLVRKAIFACLLAGLSFIRKVYGRGQATFYSTGQSRPYPPQ